MQRQRTLNIAKVAVIVSALPFLLWAYEYGPDAGYSGVPRESGTCTSIGCHVGTANSGSGSVTVSFPNGMTYVPGVQQHLTVTISDSAQRAWGFQLTPRLASNSATLAGTLASSNANTQLMCASSNLFTQQAVPFSAGGAQTCPATMPLQYVEHSLVGYNTTRGTTGSATYEFDWTPPATDVGAVDIYVAGNAANGDLTTNGDRIYTTKYTLQPGAAGTTPSILPNGAISAGAYGAFTSIAPGTWMEVYGANLSQNTREWSGSDFNGINAPTSLDGVKVTVGGQPAYVSYISPGQVNAQIPFNVSPGTAQLTVTNNTGTSAAYSITVNSLQPGLLAPVSFVAGGKSYILAQTTDQKLVMPTGAIPGLSTRPAKPGETLVLYGIGFGPAATSANVSIPSGQLVQEANHLTNSMTMAFNDVPATLSYAGLSPNYVGLYQFNVVVPVVADNDAVAVTFKLNGVAGTQTIYTSVHQ